MEYFDLHVVEDAAKSDRAVAGIGSEDLNA